jgi:hypothetical protein
MEMINQAPTGLEEPKPFAIEDQPCDDFNALVRKWTGWVTRRVNQLRIKNEGESGL